MTWLKDDLHIDSDEELVAMANTLSWAGTGAADDPYIIEDYVVDHAIGSNEIYIGNTTVGLRIIGCHLSGADRPGQAGLMLFNVTGAEVQDCTIDSNYDGVVIEGCSNIVLRSLSIAGNGADAIKVLDSEEIILVGNNFSVNAEGLRVDSSQVTAYDNLFRSNTGLAVRSTASPTCLYYENVFIENNGSGTTYDPTRVQASDGSTAAWDMLLGQLLVGSHRTRYRR